jgi:hypothetical protein
MVRLEGLGKLKKFSDLFGASVFVFVLKHGLLAP